jgi:hypothetical protein
MARVRQPYDEPVDVPWLGRVVNPGQVVDVPDDHLPHYLAAGWTEAAADTRKEARK